MSQKNANSGPLHVSCDDLYGGVLGLHERRVWTRAHGPNTRRLMSHGHTTHGPSTSRPNAHTPNKRRPDTHRPSTRAPRTRRPNTRRPRTSSPNTHGPRTHGPIAHRPSTRRPNTQAHVCVRPAGIRPMCRHVCVHVCMQMWAGGCPEGAGFIVNGVCQSVAELCACTPSKCTGMCVWACAPTRAHV